MHKFYTHVHYVDSLILFAQQVLPKYSLNIKFCESIASGQNHQYINDINLSTQHYVLTAAAAALFAFVLAGEVACGVFEIVNCDCGLCL